MHLQLRARATRGIRLFRSVQRARVRSCLRPSSDRRRRRALLAMDLAHRSCPHASQSPPAGKTGVWVWAAAGRPRTAAGGRHSTASSRAGPPGRQARPGLHLVRIRLSGPGGGHLGWDHAVHGAFVFCLALREPGEGGGTPVGSPNDERPAAVAVHRPWEALAMFRKRPGGDCYSSTCPRQDQAHAPRRSSSAPAGWRRFKSETTLADVGLKRDTTRELEI
jgi:hypothetical protein